MGWTIGMPSLKLNNVGGKSKHCGSFSSVAGEALEERRGRDSDIDVNRSGENVYSGFRSAAELEEYSRRHVAELSARQVAAGGRKIRDDAVVMCATIIKPPAAMMNELTREEQIRFFSDSKAKFAEIVGEGNIKSDVIHFDEQGSHMHVFWEPITPDGRLCAKEMHNLQFLGRLNKEMPEHLRGCGWDVADCRIYDQAKEALKTEKERAEEAARHGRSSAAYKLDAEREKQKILADVEKLKVEVADNKKLIQKQEKELEDLKRTMKGPIGRIRPLQEEIKALEAENGQLRGTIETLREDILEKKTEINSLNSEIFDRDIELKVERHTVEDLQKENSWLKDTLKKLIEYIKERFPEIYKAVERIIPPEMRPEASRIDFSRGQEK